MRLSHSPASAADRANAVIGLYGDPNVSWSIVLQAELTADLDPHELQQRLHVAARTYPHLGPGPAVDTVPAEHLPDVRERFAAAAYESGAPLVRAAVAADQPRLVLAAHHGAVDGIGLLALLGFALDIPVTSAAAGVGARRAGHSFVSSAARRLVEALFTPPARIRSRTGSGRPDAGGDVLRACDQPRMKIGAAAFTAAATKVTKEWNRRHGRRGKRIVAAVGASYRSGACPTPKHESTFFRLRVSPDTSTRELTRLLGQHPPEPDFPARSSRLARMATRMLANRLGSTFLVSNLGVVSAGDRVRSLAFYPAASGRCGVSFGAVTVADTSTVTVRTRRRDFDQQAADELVELLSRALRDSDRLTAGGTDELANK